MFIFLDESGVTKGFDEDSSETFNIAILIVKDPSPITRIVKKFNKKMVSCHWPREIEIKAYELFRAKHNRKVPEAFTYKHNSYVAIQELLQKLSTCDILVDYITVNKSEINENLKTAPYGILYNYYASKILIPRIHDYQEVLIRADAKSKEMHTLRKFDGYIETEAYVNIKHPLKLRIEHLDSRQVYGIRATDFISWSIFRKYESGDDRFYKTIEGKIGNKQEWHYKK
jgi:hypothetical protein